MRRPERAVRRLREFVRSRGSRLAVLALLLPSVAGARQDAPTAGGAVQERANATLIEIPVNVVGHDGKPIAGLTVADFELFDDGKKQPISGMDVIDLSKPAALDAPVPASARRLWLLVFDLSYTTPSALSRARDGARRFVNESMSPNDLAAVGTLALEAGWKLLVNFTRDRRQLDYAISTLGLSADFKQSRDPLSFAFVPPGPDGSQGGPSASMRGDLVAELRDVQRLQQKSNDDQARGQVTKLMGDIGGIGRVLDSARGKKHVLYFSEGFESRLMSGHMAGGDAKASLSQDLSVAASDTSTPQGAASAASVGDLWKVDSDARFGSSATRGVLTGELAQFNRSDVTLDAIDISGLRGDADVNAAYTAGSGAGKAGSGTDALFAMSAATNGELIRNANELGGELRKLEERSTLVYLLIYQPKNLSRPGALHALQVKVKTPGAKVFARTGYYEPRPYGSLSPIEKVLASGDLVTGGTGADAMPGSLLVVPFASPTADLQLPVILEIPGAALLAGDSGSRAAVQIYVYANDSAGTLVDYLATEMTLDLSIHRAALEASGLKFFGLLTVGPGDYGVRALVRNGTTSRTGVYATTLHIPAIPGGAPTVLPPLFEEPPGRWLMVKGNPRADAPPRPADYPFAVAGAAFIPSAVPGLSTGAATPVAIVAYNFGVSENPAPLDVRAEVVAADGKSQPADVKVTQRSDIERGGGRKLVMDFQPRGLAPGRYALKVSITDPSSKKTAQSSGPFDVR